MENAAGTTSARSVHVYIQGSGNFEMADIVDQEAAPHPEIMNYDKARKCLDRILAKSESLWTSIIAFHEGQGWQGLGYSSWAECARKEIPRSRTYARRLMEAAEISGSITGAGDRPSETQCRLLAKVPEDKRQQVWDDATASSQSAKGDEVVTAGAIRTAIVKATSDGGEPEPQDDATGPELTPAVVMALSEAKVFRELAKRLSETSKLVADLHGLPQGQFLNLQAIQAELTNAKRHIVHASPAGPCPYCAQKGCKTCHDNGWVPKGIWDAAPDEMK